MEDRAHPLRVAPCQVVVHRHDVHAAPGHRVEGRGQRRHEGLAFARLHLGDPALVQDDPTHELDVELAHPERSLHRLAAHREHFGEDIVEGLLEALVLALPAGLRELAAALEVRVLEFVLGWLVGLGDLEDLLADLGEPGADLPSSEGPRTTRPRARSSHRRAAGRA